jgi:excisionase family DNA binding protein
VNTALAPSSLPSEHESELARTSGRDLSVVLASRAETQQFDFKDDKGETHSVKLATSALRLLIAVLSEIGQGNAVSIIPIHAELTTQEAANLLNVSRPYLVQLLEKGDIPFRKVNTHRRVRYQDVIDYKQRIDNERLKALDELTAQAQELGMGY